ncbi:hypothetical protein BU14_0937s0003 [Porphyra umbilicalis]|uniref:Uncharacterized protein n=1 Tax=Porphyra umbilicalis TaxID=2786 RepID=A0A1X6NNJ2_PORUM|nr:hypothetical protein BU14_0937s0003 [Porphyra umbilicalis]|eukprot:OSX70056.1 hypothetical protein BU14_0937s0003 [Porphyra umbilicalis]
MAGGQPAAPAGGQPAAPAGEQLAAPAGEQPAAPAGEQPAAPAGEQPAAPAGEQPAAPAGEQPAAPAGEQPAAPAGEQPAAPAGEQPAAPAGALMAVTEERRSAVRVNALVVGRSLVRVVVALAEVPVVGRRAAVTVAAGHLRGSSSNSPAVPCGDGAGERTSGGSVSGPRRRCFG